MVDDEAPIVQLARMYLTREGFRTDEAREGVAALQRVEQGRPALIVLDVMLPGLDGFEVCRRLRQQGDQTPILMLTARDDDIDKIIGLELGADDYLTKPFNPRELVARVKAILRREERAVPTESKPIHVADLTIDPSRREVKVGERRLELRTQEFELLLTLAIHRGMVMRREKLLELAWGFDFYGQTRTVDVHIANLRRKLQGCAARIETVTGVGYRLME